MVQILSLLTFMNSFLVSFFTSKVHVGCQHLGVEPKIGGFHPPKWMVKIMENPMNKWMILVGKHTPIFGSTPISICE